MKRTLFALLVSLSAFAQAPIVQSITPDQDRDTGGTLVVIRGSNLSTPVVCIVPCPPRVVFGALAVDATEVSDQELHVVTPPHPAGTVDVSIVIPGRPGLLMEDAFTFIEGIDAPYEKVLLPMYFPGEISGAYGTRWKTDLSIYNGSENAALIADAVCPPDLACPPVIPLTVGVAPGGSLLNPPNFFRPTRANTSLILYVSKPAASDVSFGLRVADTSRSALNGGTDLPVVRGDEFLTGTGQFLNVPLNGAQFRLLLRIYDVAHDETDFTVRIHPADEKPTTPIYSTTVRASTPSRPPFRSEAAYAELDITQLLMLRLAWPDQARIEIVPGKAGSRYWAFVSLTNNETQLVTLITPQ